MAPVWTMWPTSWGDALMSASVGPTAAQYGSRHPNPRRYSSQGRESTDDATGGSRWATRRSTSLARPHVGQGFDPIQRLPWQRTSADDSVRRARPRPDSGWSLALMGYRPRPHGSFKWPSRREPCSTPQGSGLPSPWRHD